MTKSKFIKTLEELELSYFEQGNKIIIDEEGPVDLEGISEIPSNVCFRNLGEVYLEVLTIPKGTEFENKGFVSLSEATKILEGVSFRNRGDVFIPKIKTIDSSVLFKNSMDISFESIEEISSPVVFSNGMDIYFLNGRIPELSKGVRFENGKKIITFNKDLDRFLSIEGIRTQKILNCMIKQIY